MELFAKETFRAESERHAHLITAINLGNHGKPSDIKRVIKDLIEPAKQESLTVDEALKLAKGKASK